MTVAMLAITISLGVWQLERLAWKRQLLQNIAQGEAAPAVPLPRSPAPFTRVVAQGRFRLQQARYGAEVRSTAQGPLLGSHVLAALEQPSGRIIIVDRGWAADKVTPETPSGTSNVEGYVRSPEHTPWMGAKDDLAGRHFYALDPIEIGRSLGVQDVAPFTLVAIGSPGSTPEPVQQMPTLPNDHLSYAVTWFALSLALMVVFAVFVHQTGRDRKTG